MTSRDTIRIERFTHEHQLAPLRGQWNALARGVAFRSFEWLESWWRTYGVGQNRQLCVLGAFGGDGRLAGIAPWYLEAAPLGGRTLRFLGSGEVCSDYMSVLCDVNQRDAICTCIVDWLSTDNQRPESARTGWNRLELDGVDAADETMARILEAMLAAGHLVSRRSRASCWRIHLPESWDAYLKQLSRSHRKQLRRLERHYFDSGRALLHLAANERELGQGLEALVRLHQRRRASLGERGAFASTRFIDFHAETAQRLLAKGNLRLVWLELDGQIVAAEYQVLGDGVVYAYQSGIEPTALQHEPGRLITLASLQLAIAEHRRAFDFLRGDEAYKAHWRAVPRPSEDVIIQSDTRGARLRHNLSAAGHNLKSLLRDGLNRSGEAARRRTDASQPTAGGSLETKRT